MLQLLGHRPSRPSLLTSLRHRSQRGVTAVEFALLLPAFMLFLIGIVEMSLLLLTQHLLENATFNASRLAKTGYTATGKTQEQTVMAELTRRLSGLGLLIDTDKVTLTSVAYANLSDIGQPDQGETNTYGGAQQVVVYTVSYPWKFFTPLIGNIVGGVNRTITLTSRIVVRNEPYDN